MTKQLRKQFIWVCPPKKLEFTMTGEGVSRRHEGMADGAIESSHLEPQTGKGRFTWNDLKF